MRVIAVTGDKGACRHYRLDCLAPRLEDSTLTVRTGLPARTDGKTGKLKGFPRVDADVIVFQRPTLWWMPIAAAIHQSRGVKIVVELDDDLHSLASHNAAFPRLNPNANPHRNWRHLGDMVKLADLVTVSTDALADRYGSHGRVVVLRNMIDAAWLDMAPPKQRVIGWTGTLSNHKGDLAVTHGGVASASTQADCPVRVIGTPDGVAEELGLGEGPEVVKWLPFDAYPRQVARFEVGIAPLAGNAFNAAKSWLKPLEYAALGVPVVMSPVPEYRLLHDRGVGYMAANRSREWRRGLVQLLSDDRFRAEQIEAGRLAARQLTVQGNAWRWEEAWTDAGRRMVRSAA